jgi:hypothetical protein
MQQNRTNLAAFNKSLTDLPGKVHDELAAVQQWQGDSRTAFDGVITDQFAAAIAKVTPVIQDAEAALGRLISTIQETATRAESVPEPGAGRPGLGATAQQDAALSARLGLPTTSATDAYNQMVNLINGLASDFYGATKAYIAIHNVPWPAPQSTPVPTTTDPRQAPGGPTGPGKAPAAPVGQPKMPGGSPIAPKGANPGAGGQPQSPGGGDSSMPSTSGDSSGNAPLDLAGAPSAPPPTTLADPPPPQTLPDPNNGITPFVPPNTVPPTSVPTLAGIKPVKQPSFTEPKFTEPKLAGPSAPENLADPVSTSSGVSPVGTNASGSGPTATSPTLADDVSNAAAGRGGMPYMPPMGGMGNGMGRSGTEVRPGVAEGPGGPALGPGAGKKSEYAGVPDELRGRSADKPAEQRSRRRRAKKPIVQAESESSGEVLDEHLWQVERPRVPGV